MKDKAFTNKSKFAETITNDSYKILVDEKTDVTVNYIVIDIESSSKQPFFDNENNSFDNLKLAFNNEKEEIENRTTCNRFCTIF